MIITNKLIESFNPCDRGLRNFNKHYPNFKSYFGEILDLENIPLEDKIWLVKKILSKNQLVNWAILCSESVINLYEEEFPTDLRPRDCLEYLKTISDFDNLNKDQKLKIEGYRRGLCVYCKEAPIFVSYVASTASAAFYTDLSDVCLSAIATIRDIGRRGGKERLAYNLQLLKMAL